MTVQDLLTLLRGLNPQTRVGLLIGNPAKHHYASEVISLETGKGECIIKGWVDPEKEETKETRDP